MAVIFNQPVNIKKGTNVLGPVTIQNAITSLVVTLANWGTSPSVDVLVEETLDGAVTWVPVIGATLNPVDRFGNPIDVTIRLTPWRLCTCGELYQPGAALNGITTNHSTYKGWTSAQVANIFPGQMLHVADPGAFHNPDNTPDLGAPNRRARVTYTSPSVFSTVLTVDAV